MRILQDPRRAPHKNKNKKEAEKPLNKSTYLILITFEYLSFERI